MRFSYLLTAFLAGLSIASPIANPEPAAEDAVLEVRGGRGGRGGHTGHGGHAGHGGQGGKGGKGGQGGKGGKGGEGSSEPKIVETPEFQRAKLAHSNLQDGHSYYFTDTQPLGPHMPAADGPQRDLQELQHRLGFAHISVVFGTVKFTEKDKGKKHHTITKDFVSYRTDLTMYEDQKTKLDTPKKWDPKKVHHLKYGGTTTAKKVENVRGKVWKEWKEEHPMYNVDTNNCNLYAEYVIHHL